MKDAEVCDKAFLHHYRQAFIHTLEDSMHFVAVCGRL